MPADVSCLLHVHSTYSDGTAAVPELIDAAAAGADVILLTDHDTIQARRDGWEGRHGRVLLIVGHEISPRGGHLLAFDTPAEVPHAGRTDAELCAAVRAAGGFGIAAHPFSQGSRMSRRIGRPHPWGALDACGCVGLELWSLTTDVAEEWGSPLAAVRSLRDPAAALDGPPQRHLELWDALCARRRTVAVGGLDAHQPGLRLRGRVRSIMPNRVWFSLLRTHVLVDESFGRDERADRAAVLAALRGGRCYLARTDIGDPAGFRFGAESGDGRVLRMGNEAALGDGWELTAWAPASAGIRLLRNGRELTTERGTRMRRPAREPGVYRGEAWRSVRGARRRWISNPVYLR